VDGTDAGEELVPLTPGDGPVTEGTGGACFERPVREPDRGCRQKSSMSVRVFLVHESRCPLMRLSPGPLGMGGASFGGIRRDTLVSAVG